MTSSTGAMELRGPHASVKGGLRVLEVPLNRPGAAGSLRARGITKESLAPYRAAGGQGFGIRSALYRPGLALDAVERAARAFTEAWSMGFE